MPHSINEWERQSRLSQERSEQRRGEWDPDRFMRQLEEDLAALPRPSWWSIWVCNPVAGWLLGLALACGIVIGACLLIPITDDVIAVLLGVVLGMTLPSLGAVWGSQ